MIRAPLPASLALAALLAAAPAAAQMETREGIALQNQILQLRQEIELLRRGQGAPAAPAAGGGFLAPPRAPGAPPAGAPQAELLGQLLDRVATLEGELRLVRGRAEQAEFRERTLREQVEKLQGDLDFRLRQIEERGQGTAPAAAPAASRPAQPAAAPEAAARRTPQRALAEGQAALQRRDFAAAEAAAREVIQARDTPRLQDAHLLLADSLAGRRDFAGAAVSYDDAFRANRQSGRAPEAMLGVATALAGLGDNRAACGQLATLRTTFPNLQPALAERAAQARQRAQCR